MKELTAWLARQAKLEQRSPSLEDAFLHDRFIAYAFQRLRFFLPRVLFNWSLHLAGLWLLYKTFSPRQFGVIAIAHLAAAFAASFWWGSLEEMRGHIRHLYRSGRRGFIAREIGRRVALSLRISLAILIGASLWAVGRLAFAKSPFGVVDAYLLAIVLRLALEIPCRCYHSGLYAIRRIYRPLPAMLAVDAFGFVGLLALRPVLGQWSFPLVSLLSAVTMAAVTLYYTTRAYRLFGFHPSRSRGHARRLERHAVTEMVTAGLASGIMCLDALIALVVLDVGTEREDFGILVLTLFAISPGLRAAGEWAQLFYFDLKRLETIPFGNLTAWLGSRVFRLAWVTGPFFWAVACLANLIVGGDSLRIWLALLPLLHSRSLLTAIQVRLFTDGAYGLLIWTGVFCLGAYLAASLLQGGVVVLLGLAAANYCALLLLTWRQARRRFLGRRGGLLPPAAWFQHVSRIRSPVRLVAMRYCPDDAKEAWNRHREATQRAARRLARDIALNLGTGGAVTVIHPGRILWVDTAPSCGPHLIRLAITSAAGLLELVGQTEVQPNGSAALRQARSRVFFGADLSHGLPAESRSIPQRAHAAFLELFPNGLVWTPGGPPAGLMRLSRTQTRNLLVGASIFARDLYPGRGSGFEVTGLCAGNQLRLVFVVPLGSSTPVARRRWRGFIRTLNLDAALGPLAGARSAPISPRPEPQCETVALGPLIPANFS